MIESLLDAQLFILLGGFIIVAIAANQISKVFKLANLPLITGFIMTGIIAGPYFLELIPQGIITHLGFVNELSLAFIAFAAGAELYLKELRSRFNSIKWNTFGQLVITFLVGSLGVYFIADLIPYMKDLNATAKVAVAILTGTIFVARSPASAIAVVNELRARGPFTQTVMGVTVLKDFIVIVLFAVNLSVAKTLISGDDFNIFSVVLILLELGMSIGLGYAYGFTLRYIMSWKIKTIYKTIGIVLFGYSAYLLGHFTEHTSNEYLGFDIAIEPLLICIIASFFVTNYSRYRVEFLKILEETSPYIYIGFFTLTGATMEVDVLWSVSGIAVILFLIRLVTMVMGSYVGGILAKDPIKHMNYGWMPYITQAGVALGLSTIIASTFPGWGNQFATVVIAVIVLNQFLGPPLFKYSLNKLGEDHSKADPAGFDGIRDAIIFGLENQSIALARQLISKDWKVQLATKKKRGSFQEPEDITVVYVEDVTLEVLLSMEADKTEAIVCMLSDEENYKICDLAYEHLGTRDLIVRLNERWNYDRFLALEAKIVDPSTAIVSLLDHFVRSPLATSLLLGMADDQDTRDIELENPNIHGIPLRELRLPNDVIILSIKRAGQMIISHGYTRLRVNDIVTVVGSNQSLDEISLRFSR
ncbi:MAG: cation:proton antiporter [bacterium]|nr:cation:proton antiporter [bacterium]